MEARIEILNRLSVKYGKCFLVEDFEQLLKLCDTMTVILVVRLAMAEYSNQSRKNNIISRPES